MIPKAILWPSWTPPHQKATSNIQTNPIIYTFYILFDGPNATSILSAFSLLKDKGSTPTLLQKIGLKVMFTYTSSIHNPLTHIKQKKEEKKSNKYKTDSGWALVVLIKKANTTQNHSLLTNSLQWPCGLLFGPCFLQKWLFNYFIQLLYSLLYAIKLSTHVLFTSFHYFLGCHRLWYFCWVLEKGTLINSKSNHKLVD